MKKIAIIPNSTKDKNYKYTRRLAEFLKGKADIVMPEKEKKSKIDVEYRGKDLYDGVDCVIILGGDGTMLRVAEPCGKNQIPVMGVNLGKIGFMTEVEIDDMESATEKLLSNDYTVEKHMMMEISVLRKDGTEEKYIALNDAVISKPNSDMIKMELYKNEEKASEYIADGLIISTPTGSTGYSLSAGGPVADPTMDLFIATPICAHRLSARPMLLSAQKEITLKLTDGGDILAQITVDGNDKCTINKEDAVKIIRSEYVFNTIKLGKQSFYYTMMSKL